MPGQTKVVFAPDHVVFLTDDVADVMRRINTASGAAGSGGFVDFTLASGETVYIAVGKIRCVEPE